MLVSFTERGDNGDGNHGNGGEGRGVRDARYGRYALAALDMDNTLLNSDHVMTPYTVRTLNRAAEAGKAIALCTGRCLSELWHHFAACPGIGYAIAENGSCLYDVNGARTLMQLSIPDETAHAILDMAGDYDVCVQCFLRGQSHMQLPGPEALGPYHVAEYAPVFNEGSKYIPDVRALIRERGGTEKFNLFFARQVDKAAFWARLKDFDLFATDSLGHGIELSPLGASKSEGLKRLCDHLGIPLAASIGVGDGGNDVDLVRSAGLGVAMGNASDAVKAAADVVVEDCDHDGAALAVRRYLLGEDL